MKMVSKAHENGFVPSKTNLVDVQTSRAHGYNLSSKDYRVAYLFLEICSSFIMLLCSLVSIYFVFLDQGSHKIR